MVISYIRGGLGNQFFQYAMGRRLAHKLNTEFKLDTTFYDKNNFRPYALNSFNINAEIATPEEIARVKNFHNVEEVTSSQQFMPEVLNYPDNVWLYGYWGNEKYFADIADILREEFTLRQPLGESARIWQKKILDTDCPVSLHVRHGDLAYNPAHKNDIFTPLPLNYYRECVVNCLKRQYKNLTVFVFSDNLQWCKENLRLGVPTEFVRGGDNLLDVEELHLMSLCKHNIIANSTFSWWGAWLNRNPDKKVFAPIPASFVDTNKTYYGLSATPDENSAIDSDRWIRVPFNPNDKPDVTMCPIFSLLLVVNDNADYIVESLESLLGQDYKFFELIIIDNASADGSGKICREVAQSHDNVTLIKLYEKISDGAAWNKAFDLSQGRYVIFLRGGDKFFPESLTSLYMINEHSSAEVFNSTVWLRENNGGNIDVAGKKFVMETDTAFHGKKFLCDKFDKLTLLKIFAANEVSTPIAVKMFKRKFLTDNGIRFNEKISDAETVFVVNAMLQADEMIFMSMLFYVAPKN